MCELKENKEARSLLDFIQRSPSAFHAVANVCAELEKNDFVRLEENKKWLLKAGGKYFVTRNASSVIAFTIPEGGLDSFMICASHSDSPSFKIKESPVLSSSTKNQDGKACLKLNVEPYGGMLCAPWFDRPLSFAGRLIYKDDKGESSSIVLRQKLVDVNRDLLMIPSLAIHMNREANSGYAYNAARDMLPLLGIEGESSGDVNSLFNSILSKASGIKTEDIVSSDLFLYCRSQPAFWGADNEFISSPKLDDLECLWTSLKAFLQASPEISRRNFSSPVPVYAVFDNEEVGSRTRQGAESTFLVDTLERLACCLSLSEEDFKILLAKSFMVSADNAHAVHPNYEGEADPINRPVVNGGPVIKFNAEQRYTTDSISAGFFKQVCKKAGVPFQIFTNRSDKRGGSTLGNISGTQVSVPTVDIGLAQWAMHSPYESAGSLDVSLMIKALTEYFSSSFCLCE